MHFEATDGLLPACCAVCRGADTAPDFIAMSQHQGGAFAGMILARGGGSWMLQNRTLYAADSFFCFYAVACLIKNMYLCSRYAVCEPHFDRFKADCR